MRIGLVRVFERGRAFSRDCSHETYRHRYPGRRKAIEPTDSLFSSSTGSGLVFAEKERKRKEKRQKDNRCEACCTVRDEKTKQTILYMWCRQMPQTKNTTKLKQEQHYWQQKLLQMELTVVGLRLESLVYTVWGNSKIHSNWVRKIPPVKQTVT